MSCFSHVKGSHPNHQTSKMATAFLKICQSLSSAPATWEWQVWGTGKPSLGNFKPPFQTPMWEKTVTLPLLKLSSQQELTTSSHLCKGLTQPARKLLPVFKASALTVLLGS